MLDGWTAQISFRVGTDQTRRLSANPFSHASAIGLSPGGMRQLPGLESLPRCGHSRTALGGVTLIRLQLAGRRLVWLPRQAVGHPGAAIGASQRPQQEPRTVIVFRKLHVFNQAGEFVCNFAMRCISSHIMLLASPLYSCESGEATPPKLA